MKKLRIFISPLGAAMAGLFRSGIAFPDGK
jgi:hypothetical protein